MPKTILVTGATGYIAKHLVLQLLKAGHHVVGSVRSLSREAEMHAALRPHLSDPSTLENLRLVALDLSRDDGWQEAMNGVDVVFHTASPFPMTQPKDEEETIRPAVDGALRAVRAAEATGIKRVIMTSSTVAIMIGDLPAGQSIYDESNWSDLSHSGATPYAKSKTMAEQAVWDWQAHSAPEMEITMINPALVLGAPLDQNFGTSIKLIKRMMKGSDPMLPDIAFPCVDVQDIAAMHIAAMETSASIGQRYAGAERLMRFAEIAAILKQDYPDRKIPTRVAPNFMIRMLSVFDVSIKSILHLLGRSDMVSNAKAKDELGVEFKDARESVRSSGRFLIDNGLV